MESTKSLILDFCFFDIGRIFNDARCGKSKSGFALAATYRRFFLVARSYTKGLAFQYALARDLQQRIRDFSTAIASNEI